MGSAYYGLTAAQHLKHMQHVWRKLENFQYNPELAELEPLTYYNNHKHYEPINLYDYTFNAPEGWDQHRPREDRRTVSQIHSRIYDEEVNKVIPVLTSFWHGRPTLPQIDDPGKQFNRRPQVSSFYRRTGINVQTEHEMKPSS